MITEIPETKGLTGVGEPTRTSTTAAACDSGLVTWGLSGMASADPGRILGA